MTANRKEQKMGNLIGHQHKAIKSRHVCFINCVNPHNCNEVAHGGICIIETCSCKAERYTNSNQGRLEIGKWFDAEPTQFDETSHYKCVL
jgi:hypothetical protein